MDNEQEKSFIQKHKVLVIVLTVIAILIVICLIIRAKNMSNKTSEEESSVAEEVSDQVNVSSNNDAINDTTTKQSDYQSSLSIKAQEEKKKQDEIAKKKAEQEEEERKKAEEEAERKEQENREPTYGDAVVVWGSDGVPDKMEDGRSIKDYLSKVSLSDFGSKWGDALTLEDKFTEDIYMVGVDQNPNDTLKGVQNQSFGWLIDNIDNLPDNGAIKFTDLNVVGSLADDHVALLCCYNWYSVWGLKETMLVFEDISGTLSTDDFKSGDIFSAYIYKHNVKVTDVNGQTVICVQYNKFQ